MENFTIDTDPRMLEKFDAYPEYVKPKLNFLRNLVFEVASEIPHLNTLEETLKWGEPSYLVKKGSTLRMDWKAKSPEKYAMYFKCTSKLVTTFKEVFGDIFQYETTRAITFQMDDKVPVKELKECIRMTLCYHLVKDLPLLGYKSRN